MVSQVTSNSVCATACSDNEQRKEGWHYWPFNTLRPRQNGRHFPDDIFKCIFLNENILNPIKSSLKFVPKGSINNIPALVQIMAWRRPGDKPLSEPMMINLPTHICVARPQWVKLWGGPSVTGGFPSERASNVESVSMSWCHHVNAW